MLGKFHISLSNRLLHLATTKLAIVLYFGYTVNTFWLGSGRLPVKLNYNECQEHITISFSKHEAQFSGKQPYAMFSHTPSATQRAEFSCCWRKKILKRQSTDLLLWVKKNLNLSRCSNSLTENQGRFWSVWKGSWRKAIPFLGTAGMWCLCSGWTRGLGFHGHAHIPNLQKPPNPAGDIKAASLRRGFRVKQNPFETMEIYFRENFRVLVKNAQRRTGLGRGTVRTQSSALGKDLISQQWIWMVLIFLNLTEMTALFFEACPTEKTQWER